MADNYLLELKNISYTHADSASPLISGLDLSVKGGEVVVIYGFNGCGKSTLLRLINNDLPEPYDGDVYIGGSRLQKGDFFDYSRISFLEQSPDTANFHRVKGELLDGGMVEESDVLEIAEYFRCKSLLDKRMLSLSGGQKRIVKIMKTFLKKESDIILLDEPINNLDRTRAVLLSNYIKDFIARYPEKAVIIVTHCRMFPGVTAYNMEGGKLTPLNADSVCGTCFGTPDDRGYYKVDEDFSDIAPRGRKGFLHKIKSALGF